MSFDTMFVSKVETFARPTIKFGSMSFGASGKGKATNGSNNIIIKNNVK